MTADHLCKFSRSVGTIREVCSRRKVEEAKLQECGIMFSPALVFNPHVVKWHAATKTDLPFNYLKAVRLVLAEQVREYDA